MHPDLFAYFCAKLCMPATGLLQREFCYGWARHSLFLVTPHTTSAPLGRTSCCIAFQYSVWENPPLKGQMLFRCLAVHAQSSALSAAVIPRRHCQGSTLDPVLRIQKLLQVLISYSRSQSLTLPLSNSAQLARRGCRKMLLLPLLPRLPVFIHTGRASQRQAL